MISNISIVGTLTYKPILIVSLSLSKAGRRNEAFFPISIHLLFGSTGLPQWKPDSEGEKGIYVFKFFKTLKW